MNFNQMFNSLFHNQMNQRIRQEVDQIQQIWANDPHQRTFLKQNNPELAAALESGDRKKLEKIVGDKLNAVATDLRLLIDNANAPILGTDAHGCVNEWNNKAAEITGYTKQEVTGRYLVRDFIIDE